MYSSILLIGSSRLLILKSVNNSFLIQLFVASLEVLSEGVPALDIEYIVLCKGKSSL